MLSKPISHGLLKKDRHSWGIHDHQGGISMEGRESCSMESIYNALIYRERRGARNTKEKIKLVLLARGCQ